MPLSPYAASMLDQEARALLTRLARVKPFALQETMLPAAGLLPDAQVAIEDFLVGGRKRLHALIGAFLVWLKSPHAATVDAEEAQRRFTMVRLRFNAVLTQFDVFENVITQRSEHETGVWLSGLDVVSADALTLRGQFFDPPPVICYLDRGVGAAIRRARTRLPGGGDNPVAIVKVPRERMVGTGIASSLIHEVGHQAAALLDLVDSIRPVLRGVARRSPVESEAWQLWERWISEIVADLWSVARVGISSTMGLIGVVSLPRAFVFRLSVQDPHPVPWIRVKLSAALGKALHPQPLWDKLAALWDSYYPLDGLDEEQRRRLDLLQRTIPGLVEVLINHRPAALHGQSVRDAMDLEEFRPAHLSALAGRWRTQPQEMYKVRPLLAFAAIGQGRAEGTITPEEESAVLAKLLTHWALRSTLDAAAGCAAKRVHHCTCGNWKRIEQNTTTTRSMSWH
jgi:hypothetical protein